MNAGAVAIHAQAGRNSKRIARSRQHEVAVAAHRAGQRANISAKGDIIQLNRAMARRIVKRDAAGQVQTIDRQRAQIEFSARHWPVDPALRIETEIERHPVDRQFVRAPLAAHQGAEAELHIELVGPDLAQVIGAADHHGAQPQRWRRQQPRIELAGNADRRANHTGGLGLELRPELIPVDEVRPDQRGH